MVMFLNKIITKNIYLILSIIPLVIFGCEGNKQSANDFILVDVNKSYPKKDLILQDFMDVEYLALETANDFVNQGIVMDVGEEILLVRNKADDGDIFIYDRNGKPVRKINRRVQGPEEYIFSRVTLDEVNNEIFVNDIYSREILVYDLFGKFLRNFEHKEGTIYVDVYNFDKNNLICFNNLSRNVLDGNAQFFIVSKHDGNVNYEIQIPFKEKKTVNIPMGPSSWRGYSYHTIIPYNGNWALFEISSDTVFKYSPEHKITPLVARTPSVQTMDPEVFLFMNNLTDRYFFMETVRKEEDYLSKKLVYDRQENSIFKYIVYNNDYSSKVEVSMTSQPINSEIAFYLRLEAYQLVESYNKGDLKEGKLKEIVSKLDAEDNPVIMLVKHKR